MKIIYPEWEQFLDLKENCVNCLYLEEPEYFRKILTELHKQLQGLEGGFVLSDGDKVIPLKKRMEMIFSPFLINLEDKKFYTEIYKQLQSYAMGEEMFACTMEVQNGIQSYALDLLDFLPYSLEVGQEMDLVSLFKSCGIKIQRDSECLTDQLIEYVELVTNILKKDIFVLVNFKTYFSRNEVEKIYETLLPQKIFLIDIEQQKKGYHFSCENDIIIDADLCEL